MDESKLCKKHVKVIKSYKIMQNSNIYMLAYITLYYNKSLLFYV